MKNVLSLFLMLFLSAMILPACKKDKESEHDKAIRLITARPWHNIFRGYDYNNDGKLDLGMDENAMAGIDCAQDDNYIFNVNGTYKNDGYGNTGSDGCGVGSYSGEWELSVDNVALNFDDYDAQIQTLNDSTLQFSFLIGNEKCYYIFKR